MAVRYAVFIEWCKNLFYHIVYVIMHRLKASCACMEYKYIHAVQGNWPTAIYLEYIHSVRKKWGESHIPAHVQYATNCKGGHLRTLLWTSDACCITDPWFWMLPIPCMVLNCATKLWPLLLLYTQAASEMGLQQYKAHLGIQAKKWLQKHFWWLL